MLKKRRVLFLGLMVLAGSACVTPTHASSAHSVIISTVQAAGQSGAKDEIISIHNNAATDVDITDWCLYSKGIITIACFKKSANETGVVKYILPGYGSATIVSQEHVLQSGRDAAMFSLTYAVANQTSGSIVSSTDSVQLVDAEGVMVDEKTWAVPVPSGKIWSRTLISSDPRIMAHTGLPTDWYVVDRGEFIGNSVIKAIEPPEIPEEPEIPTEPETPTDGPEDSSVSLQITEVFPNPAGTDTGREFIELYNSSDVAVLLEGVRIKVGTDSPKWINLAAIGQVAPKEYVAIYNAAPVFTLANAGGSLQLYRGELPLGGPIEYPPAKEDYSWSLQPTGEWAYVKGASPGAVNLLMTDEALLSTDKEVTAQKSCAENQYRSPETGRCRLIAASTTQQAPCKAGQERNPETQRCRNITVAQAPAPCKEGQERNPETNRCRNVIKMSTVGQGVKGVQTGKDNQPSWYFVVAIVVIVLGVLAYGVWEWRDELHTAARHIKQKFVKHTE